MDLPTFFNFLNPAPIDLLIFALSLPQKLIFLFL